MKRFLLPSLAILFSIATSLSQNVLAASIATEKNYQEWEYCAQEGEVCKIPGSNTGTVTIRYGVDGAFLDKTMPTNTPIQCTYVNMGGDPAFGVPKACYYKLTYQPCAKEGGACNVSNAYIRYGSGDQWIGTTPFSGRLNCSISTFKTDPAYGVVKSCEIATATSPKGPQKAPMAKKQQNSTQQIGTKSAKGELFTALLELTADAVSTYVDNSGGWHVRSGGLHGVLNSADPNARNWYHTLPNNTQQCLNLFGRGYVCEAGKVNDANCGSCCAKGVPSRCTDYQSGQW
jgi:hypothetical protein